jgi:predicted ArsR family transcriptional regulator
MNSPDVDQQLTRLAGLGDPIRRALYRHVAGRGVPVSRDDAAQAVGISRPLAAYHLDKLIDDGLLEARYQRRGGRQGPGAGRPAKHYLRADRQLVCGANHAMLQALSDHLDGDPPVRAVLDPQPGRCCVALRRADGLRSGPA